MAKTHEEYPEQRSRKSLRRVLFFSKRNKAAEKTAAVQDASRRLENKRPRRTRDTQSSVPQDYIKTPSVLSERNKAAEKTAAVQDASRRLESKWPRRTRNTQSSVPQEY